MGSVLVRLTVEGVSASVDLIRLMLCWCLVGLMLCWCLVGWSSTARFRLLSAVHPDHMLLHSRIHPSPPFAHIRFNYFRGGGGPLGPHKG